MNKDFVELLSESINKYTEVLSKVLYELDPANTCCKENEATDEYDSVALSILEDYTRNNLKLHIQNNLEYYFGFYMNDDQADEIIANFVNNIS